MKIQFDTVFEVEILHNYYTSGISKDFDIVPTARCQQQLRNYGMLFKKTGKGFVVLYEVIEDKAGNPYPRKPIEEELKFSFMLQSKNPYVLNYSDLPLDNTRGQIYYLHNLNDNQQEIKLLLSSNPQTAFISEDDRIELRPQFFQYYFESSSYREEIEILDESDNSVLKETVKIIEKTCNYPVDLRPYPPGKFILKIAGVPQLAFYADDELNGKNVFGLIDVFRNDRVPEAYRFSDANHNVVQKTYMVKIEQRKTFWKYYVILKYSQFASKDLSIAYPGNDYQFTCPSDPSEKLVKIPFISSKEIALQEKSVKGIKLMKKNGNSGGKVEIIENLPNPSVSALTPDSSGQNAYSEMFVYV